MTYLLQIQVDEEIKAKLETNDPYIIRDFVFSQKDILSKPKDKNSETKVSDEDICVPSSESPFSSATSSMDRLSKAFQAESSIEVKGKTSPSFSPNLQNIPERLRKYRKEHSLSKADMSRLLKCSSAAYLSWEAGVHLPIGKNRSNVLRLLNGTSTYRDLIL